MIVVADTTPINHLLLIGEIFILRDLFERIVIPEVVQNELLAENTPETVKDFIASSPDWIEVRSVDYLFDSELDTLDLGERDAIVLAEELQADSLLIDEKLGRRAAARRNLRIIGTLGIADQAAEEGLIDFASTLAKLKANDFYVSIELEKYFLEKDKARKSSNG
ncbi:MAG TPA: hypothetical protein PLK77_18420 [Pyrinomonadaceae bacterium]|nr:hypothetical protein [Pyrinomonadaceae bacterium]